MGGIWRWSLWRTDNPNNVIIISHHNSIIIYCYILKTLHIMICSYFYNNYYSILHVNQKWRETLKNNIQTKQLLSTELIFVPVLVIWLCLDPFLVGMICWHQVGWVTGSFSVLQRDREAPFPRKNDPTQGWVWETLIKQTTAQWYSFGKENKNWWLQNPRPDFPSALCLFLATSKMTEARCRLRPSVLSFYWLPGICLL